MINNVIADCQYIGQKESMFYWSFLFNCYLPKYEIGVYPIYLSTDALYTLIETNKSLTVLPYHTMNAVRKHIDNPQIIVDNKPLNINKEYISPILLTLIIAFSIMILIFTAAKTYPITTTKTLTELDSLNLNVTDDKYEESDVTNSDDSKEITLGSSKLVYTIKTSLGGLSTVFVTIICFGLLTSYLYINIINNRLQTNYFSTSNGDLIPLESSFINLSVTFKNSFYLPCVTTVSTNLCDPSWSIVTIDNSHTIKNPQISCTEYIINEIEKDCVISWSCTGCQTDTVSGIVVNITNTAYNIGYDHLEYTIEVNSYGKSTSKILAILPNEPNFLIKDLYSISVMMIPSVYTYYSDTPQTGFTLNTQQIIPANYYDVADYTFNRKECLTFYESNTQYYYCYNFNNYYIKPNTIGAQFKITQNPMCQYITVQDRQSILTIIANAFSLVSLVFTLAKVAVNLLYKRSMRRIYYSIWKYYQDCSCSKTKEKILEQLDEPISVEMSHKVSESKEVDFVTSPVQIPGHNVSISIARISSVTPIISPGKFEKLTGDNDFEEKENVKL
jgi:hypothetical protein